MRERGERLQRRSESLQFRINGLTSLRRLVQLPREHDISERQWSVLELALNAASARLIGRVKAATDRDLPEAANPRARRQLNAALGRIDFELARAFTFFDTYMDVLTQRRPAELGAVLAGCDVLAWEAMRRNHPALFAIEPPLVSCNRGFGASVVRESVSFPDGTPNPMPLIEIPYSRLREKYNLTSILHEAGHQALTRLKLVTRMPRALRAALARAGAPGPVGELYALWMFEIGPDFWGFCLSGVAEATAVRELFALAPEHALRITISDPHPPPFLRVLLTLDWCRRAWGRGPWDAWEQEWKRLYPLDETPPAARALLAQAVRFVPVVGETLFNQRFPELDGRSLPALFDLAAVAPDRIRRVSSTVRSGVLNLKGLTPCAQLAVFADLREQHVLGEERLDELMTEWLRRLGTARQRAH